MQLPTRLSLMIVVLLTLVLSSVNLSAESNWHAGPIPIGNQFPFSLGRTTLHPSSPEPAGEGNFTATTSLAGSNTFRLEDEYVVDSESYLLDVRLRYGIGPHLTAGLGIPAAWQGGGIFDHAIREWHSIFNLPEGKRESVEDYQFDISGTGRNGGSFAFEGRGLDLLNISPGIEWLISDGDTAMPSLSTALEFSIPSSTLDETPDSPDIMASFILSKSLTGSIWVYGGLALVVATDRRVAGLNYEAVHSEAFIDFEVLAFGSLSLLAGVYAQQSPVTGLEHNTPVNLYLDTGLRYEVADGSTLDFLVRENPAGTLTTDITALIGFSCHISNPFGPAPSSPAGLF